MSEFTSICPKCRRQILCDTQYVGLRVACPLCLQEIAMPVPPGGNGKGAPASSPVPAGSGAAGRRLAPGWLVIGGIAILLVAPLGFWAAQSPRAPSPAASRPAPAAHAAAGSVAPLAASDALAARAWWTFDQDRGSSAIDCTGNGYNLNLVGEQARLTKSAKVGSGALSLAGASCAETAGPVIDTTKSFTVAAWVKLSAINPKAGCTFVSIDGTTASGFFLQLNHRLGDHFALGMLEADNVSATFDAAESDVRVVPQVWYHLAGVHDAENQTISLYVNGTFQRTTSFTTPWLASGKTAVGRGYWARGNRDWVNGVIDDVRIYSVALSAAQIRALASMGSVASN